MNNEIVTKVSLKEGGFVVSSNAKQLYKSANALADTGQYGHATALLILASEEATKAILYCLSSLGINIDPEGIDEYERSHIKRHRLMRLAATITHYIDIDNDYDISLDNYFEGVIDLTLKMAADFISETVSQEVINSRKWWDGANSLKQRGLYVDYENGAWISPADLGKEEYMECLDKVTPVVMVARLLKTFDRNDVSGHLRDFSEKDLEAELMRFSSKFETFAKEHGLLEDGQKLIESKTEPELNIV